MSLDPSGHGDHRHPPDHHHLGELHVADLDTVRFYQSKYT